MSVQAGPKGGDTYERYPSDKLEESGRRRRRVRMMGGRVQRYIPIWLPTGGLADTKHSPESQKDTRVRTV